MKAIIPTGGRGTRMQPITFSANKHFIPVANKPLVYYPIEAIAGVGIKEVAITYNPGWLELIKSYLGSGSKWGLKFTYILQEKPLGLANVVQVCEEFMAGEPFVYHLGDNIFTGGIKTAFDHFEKTKPNGLVYMIHHAENKRMGVPYFTKDGKLTKYIEKPANPPHDFAVPGIYFLDKNAFKCFNGKDGIKPSDRGELEIPSVFQWMIDHGYRVDVLEYKDKWLDPGKFGDWLESNQYILDRKLEAKVESGFKNNTILEGRVAIGKKCRIDNSEIRGPSAIGNGVIIKNSYIGPYSAISNNCFIEGCRIENSVLMEGVKLVGVRERIDKSLIGPQTEITNGDGRGGTTEFFVGEKSVIKL